MKKLLLILLVLISPMVKSSELKTAQAKELANELKQTINNTLNKIVELEKAAGHDDKSVDLFIQQDSETASPLGLVLDSNKKVLLVTPSGQADSLGIKSGDQILALHLNGELQELESPLQLTSGQSISVSLKRGNEKKTLSGEVATTQAVAWKLQTELPMEEVVESVQEYPDGACGKISVFFRPPVTKDYYGVSINQIDGKNIVRGRETVRLRPGKHIIKLNEYISARGLRVNRPNFVKAKELEIDIEVNKTYHLAAEFDSTKRMISRGEPYWKPIVWKVTDKECEL
ncbi:MAG: hypothetical protein HWE16_16575 [Gammaproteobacteria bacterium]|nr:hypothetical protein [Gammaproteobacteria bacterium]